MEVAGGLRLGLELRERLEVADDEILTLGVVLLDPLSVNDGAGGETEFDPLQEEVCEKVMLNVGLGPERLCESVGLCVRGVTLWLRLRVGVGLSVGRDGEHDGGDMLGVELPVAVGEMVKDGCEGVSVPESEGVWLLVRLKLTSSLGEGEVVQLCDTLSVPLNERVPVGSERDCEIVGETESVPREGEGLEVDVGLTVVVMLFVLLPIGVFESDLLSDEEGLGLGEGVKVPPDQVGDRVVRVHDSRDSDGVADGDPVGE